MKVLDLFSGIGGFSLGLERAGMETIAFCEQDKFCQQVLKKHWPDVPIYDDVRTLDGKQFRGTADVICGGFPCQDISLAAPIVDGYSRGAGIDGNRSGLWSECARIIGEVQPEFAIFENVSALISGGGGEWFKRVLWDISSLGYDAEWHCIPASEIGAYHHRDRVWIIAYPGKKGLQGLFKPCSLSIQGFKNQAFPIRSNDTNDDLGFSYIPESIRMDDGVPNRSHRAKALGNSVVPQIPEIIGRAIRKTLI